MQIHQFTKYEKTSCLDIQFIFLKKVIIAKNIQKTIIFINNVSDIYFLISIIVGWMKKLVYLNFCSNLIKHYHSIMFD